MTSTLFRLLQARRFISPLTRGSPGMRLISAEPCRISSARRSEQLPTGAEVHTSRPTEEQRGQRSHRNHFTSLPPMMLLLDSTPLYSTLPHSLLNWSSPLTL